MQYSTLETGSIGFDPRNGSVYFENSPTYVGYGGVVVRPFFDANNNGTYDPDEQMIEKGSPICKISVIGIYVSRNLPIYKLS